MLDESSLGRGLPQFPLDLLDGELQLAEGCVLVGDLVEVSEAALVHAAHEAVRSLLHGLGLVADGLRELAGLEGRGGNDVVPLLAGQGLNDLLLVTALATPAHALVLADGHFGKPNARFVKEK